MGNVKDRSAELHAAALRIVAEFGIERLDTMQNPARAAQLRVFKHQLIQETEANRETARQHIAKACRRLRSPDAPVPQWGGKRK